MLEEILAPISGWGLLILRVGLGVIFPFHAWPKLNPRDRQRVRPALLGS